MEINVRRGERKKISKTDGKVGKKAVKKIELGNSRLGEKGKPTESKGGDGTAKIDK